MKTSIIALLLLFLFSCKDKKESIEYLLHNDKAVLWGIYDKNFKSKGKSYHLIKEENECIQYDENSIYVFDSYKGIILPLDKNNFGLNDIGIIDTWEISITRNNIYLRCMLDCYYVMNYNENYFKILTRDLDTIYLCKTPCQSNDCFIPKKVKPAPF